MLTLVATPLFAAADGLSTARTQLASVFEDLGKQDDYWFDSTGTVTQGGYTHNLRDYLSVSNRTATEGENQVTRTYLESLTYRDGQMIRRVVGDGNNVWDYDADNNTYRVVRYGNSLTGGSANGSKTFGYLDTLGTILRSRASGPTAMLSQTVEQALLARDSGSTVATSWQPFFASADISVVPEDKSIFCSTIGLNPMTMIYKWVQPSGADPVLASLAFSQTKSFTIGDQHTNWQAAFHRGAFMPGVNYRFDPGDARLISVSLRQGG